MRLLFLLLIFPLLACTIVKISSGEAVWIGSNEDWPQSFEGSPISWSYPATDSTFACRFFGFDVHNGWAQSGMNSAGLMYDGAETQPKKIRLEEGKPLFEGNLFEHILEQCSSVPQALDTFRAYNWKLPLIASHFLLADAQGRTAVIEWLDGLPAFLVDSGRTELLTNFDRCEKQKGDCWRYREGTRMLAECDTGMDDLLQLMGFLRQEGRVQSRIIKLFSISPHARQIHCFSLADTQPVPMQVPDWAAYTAGADSLFYDRKWQLCAAGDHRYFRIRSDSVQGFDYLQQGGKLLLRQEKVDSGPADHFYRHGKYTEWRENGSLLKEGTYMRNRMHGCWRYYNRRGQAVRHDVYDKGVLLEQYYF